MKHALTPIVITLGLVSATARPAHATTFIEVSTVELARRADRVEVGQVMATEARWSGARIITRVALRPDGAGAPLVWFEHAGGTVDGITMQVIGMPRFALGERVVVLLRQHRDRLHLIGLADGKLAIELVDGREHVRVRTARAPRPIALMPVADAVRALAAVGADGSRP